MSEGQGGTQEVAHSLKVMLVLFDGLDAHPLSRQHGLVARSVAWWGHELELSMATSKQEASSEETETKSDLISINRTDKERWTNEVRQNVAVTVY